MYLCLMIHILASLSMLIFSSHALASVGQYKAMPFDSERSYDSSVYPKLSIGSYGEETGSDTEEAVAVSSNDIESQNLKWLMHSPLIRIVRISSYMALGYVVLAALSTLFRGNVPIIDTILGIKSVKEQNQLLQVENESLKQIKKEHDEIWHAILNIHNTQNDVKSLADTNAASLLDMKSTLSNLELQLRRSMDEITPRLDDFERGLASNSEDAVEKIRRLQQQWESEMKSIRASIVSLQQEMLTILKDHDKIITSKFQSFKDDMKKIITSSSSSKRK